jgi:hypothetical protein
MSYLITRDSPKILIRRVPIELLTPGIPVIWTYYSFMIGYISNVTNLTVSIDFSEAIKDPKNNSFFGCHLLKDGVLTWILSNCNYTYVPIRNCKKLKKIWDDDRM